ncbi:MAG TPA: hypothetical protein VNV60_09235, partial [Holophagaceae bacterium]|nr:hypothetical protein [Holophagaceae bacterium]
MTLIVGIKTVEGIVLGSDSAATFGAGWTYTIGQMDMKKVHILGTNKDVIFGSTGSVGMAQLISNKIEVEWNANNYK